MDLHTSKKITYLAVETFFMTNRKIDKVKWKIPMLTAFEHCSVVQGKINNQISDTNDLRLFLHLFKQYFEYYLLFQSIDKDKNLRLDKEEFKKAVPVLKNWGVNIEDSDQTFDEWDND